jgi:MFS transporter, Spinster family, sphingosine-1-phosphate transporter
MTTASDSHQQSELRVLAILALINFVNFADRLVLPPLFPLLRDQFNLTSAQLGSLQTLLQVVLALATIPFGLMSDRMSRKRIIAAGVVFWSLATFLTGMAPTFAMLLVARALVGVGEAAYAPAAQSMISETFPGGARARAQAVFAAGMLLGGTAGQAAGGLLGQSLGWRPAFFAIGIPGLILAMLALRLEDPPRGPRLEPVPLGHLLGVPAYLALILSGVLITFSSIAFITWGSDFVVRYKDFSLREAGVSLGATVLVSSLIGALTGGYVADFLQKRFLYGRILTVALAFLAAAPFVLWAITTEEKSYIVLAFFTAGFFMSWYHGPVTAVIHDLTPRRAHATAVGVYMFATQLLGGMLGPFVVGKIDDLADLLLGLRVAVGVMALGALGMFLVIHFIRRDGLHHPRLDVYRAEADD